MFAISNDDDDEKTKNCQGIIIIHPSVTHSLIILIGYQQPFNHLNHND